MTREETRSTAQARSEQDGKSSPERYKLIRKLRDSQNWTAFLSEDGKGNLRTLKFIDKAKLVERYTVLARQRGLASDAAKKVAEGNAQDFLDRSMGSASRSLGRGNEHVAATLGMGYARGSNQHVIITEFSPGVDLARASESLSPRQLIFIFAQLIRGLAFIHEEGFLHLNIKPSRIYVDIGGAAPLARISDFGFAVPMGSYDGECAGTLLYMAPEVILNDDTEVGCRADLYSFGVTMYTCLTGRIPLQNRLHVGDNLTQAIEKEDCVRTPPSFYNDLVPAELDEIVLGLMRKEEDERGFASARDLLDSFLQLWPRECEAMQIFDLCEVSLLE